jgi:N-acetylglucosamine-6-sulfatase
MVRRVNVGATHRLWGLRGLSTCLLVSILLAGVGVPAATAASRRPPNIVVIMTDDQPYATLSSMHEVERTLARRGTTLTRSFAENPLCCPARASFLTGQHAHSTGVWTNAQPDGGWRAFEAHEDETIAVALDEAGYRTALIGKYLNGYSGAPGLHVPPGWDRWFAFAEPNGAYFDYDVVNRVAGQDPEIVSFGSAPRDYSTDVVAREGEAFMRSAPRRRPFFLLLAPYAPHGPRTPAPRHEQSPVGPIELRPSQSETDVSDKPAYIQARELFSEDRMRRKERRVRKSLLAVDDMVRRTVDTLDDMRRLRRTVILFISDNGSSNGHHRWGYKLVPYEESIRIPTIVRYDAKIPGGRVSSGMVSIVDWATTLARYAGVRFRTDGVAQRAHLNGSFSRRREVLLEHLDSGGPNAVPSYCGVRTKQFMFARYEDGFEESYDLRSDRWQLRNIAGSPGQERRTQRLRALARELCDPPPPGFRW